MTKNFAKSADNTMHSVTLWLQELNATPRLSRGVRAVLAALLDNPEVASYASAVDIGTAAGVNVATVTRAAQALGFSGWPEWRQEIRSRFLRHLGADQLVNAHGFSNGENISDIAIAKQLDDLAVIRRVQNYQTIQAMAQALVQARRRLIVASGSYAGIARILAHRLAIIGYRCEMADSNVDLANAIVDIDAQDVIFIIDLWRVYKNALAAAYEGKGRGAKVCVITDSSLTATRIHADYLMAVPSESASFFPSLIPALSVIECICAEMAASDPLRSQQALAAADQEWKKFGLLFYGDSKNEKA